MTNLHARMSAQLTPPPVSGRTGSRDGAFAGERREGGSAARAVSAVRGVARARRGGAQRPPVVDRCRSR